MIYTTRYCSNDNIILIFQCLLKERNDVVSDMKNVRELVTILKAFSMDAE